jgi:hypothetical protein
MNVKLILPGFANRERGGDSSRIVEMERDVNDAAKGEVGNRPCVGLSVDSCGRTGGVEQFSQLTSLLTKGKLDHENESCETYA